MPSNLVKFEQHINITESNTSVIAALSAGCPDKSKQKLKQALSYGAVWLTHKSKTRRIKRAKKILCEGDKLHLYYNETILFSQIVPASLIADEEHYSIWNKPCGMFSQASKWSEHTAICGWVQRFGLPNRNTFLVHRLDRATNGLILVAHGKKVASQLANLFETRQVTKQYKAWIEGRYSVKELPQVLDSDIDGKVAKTTLLEAHYDIECDQSQLLLSIQTGRKHQIRRHLSQHGHAIIGDRLYGSNDSSKHPHGHGHEQAIADLRVQSCYLEFNCPLTNELKSYRI